MTRIVIKDLPDNIELDRQAMGQVLGGSRLKGANAKGAKRLKPASKTLWGDLLETRRSLLR
jgi:hypothetical protein